MYNSFLQEVMPIIVEPCPRILVTHYFTVSGGSNMSQQLR